MEWMELSQTHGFNYMFDEFDTVSFISFQPLYWAHTPTSLLCHTPLKWKPTIKALRISLIHNSCLSIMIYVKEKDMKRWVNGSTLHVGEIFPSLLSEWNLPWLHFCPLCSEINIYSFEANYNDYKGGWVGCSNSGCFHANRPICNGMQWRWGLAY